jgi:hypothetical protein
MSEYELDMAADISWADLKFGVRFMSVWFIIGAFVALIG